MTALSTLSTLASSTVTNIGSMSVAQQVQLATEALALISAVMPALQNVVTELESKDSLLTKIQAVIADVEQEPAALIAQVQGFFTNLTGQGAATTTPAA